MILNNTMNIADQVTEDIELAPDEELLVRYRAEGDQDAFTALVRMYERPLFSYLRTFIGFADLAEEAVQQTWINVSQKADQYTVGRRIEPWLYAIARNQALDLIRRNKRHRIVSIDNINCELGEDGMPVTFLDMLESSSPPVINAMIQKEHEDMVWQAVDELPEKHRETIKLIYLQQLKYQEVADILGIPLGTAKSRVCHAISTLRERLQYALAIA